MRGGSFRQRVANNFRLHYVGGVLLSAVLSSERICNEMGSSHICHEPIEVLDDL